MAAVVFGPDRVSHRPRTGLVLGAGGVLGAAWMTGALACLQDRLPYDVGDADVIVGTSAGSVLAAALRCRATIPEMVAWQRGEAIGALRESVTLAARDGLLPPLPHLRLGSLSLARNALLQPHRVPPWVAASAWLPHGRGQHHTVRALVGALHRRHHQHAVDGTGGAGGAGGTGVHEVGAEGKVLPHWVDGHTWLAAVDYDTGQRVLFGQPDAPQAPLPDAVVASCSIPGWYEPAIISGRRYVDGGVRSTTSLDALSGTDVQEVYVLAPMASTETDLPLQPHLRIERRLRQLLTRVLIRHAKALSGQGKRVTVLTPGPEDLAAMGINLMDPRRRQAVLETSFRTSAAALAKLERTVPRAA